MKAKMLIKILEDYPEVEVLLQGEGMLVAFDEASFFEMPSDEFIFGTLQAEIKKGTKVLVLGNEALQSTYSRRT